MSILRDALGAGLRLGLALAAAAAPAGAVLGPTRASQVVTLISGPRECPLIGDSFDTQILPDGSMRPFSIPSGQVLVVTEVDWVVAGATPSTFAGFGLMALTLSNSPSTSFFRDGVLADRTGNARHAASVANAVVAPGAQLCIFRESTGDASALVRGFLAPNL